MPDIFRQGLLGQNAAGFRNAFRALQQSGTLDIPEHFIVTEAFSTKCRILTALAKNEIIQTFRVFLKQENECADNQGGWNIVNGNRHGFELNLIPVFQNIHMIDPVFPALQPGGKFRFIPVQPGLIGPGHPNYVGCIQYPAQMTVQLGFGKPAKQRQLRVGLFRLNPNDRGFQLLDGFWRQVVQGQEIGAPVVLHQETGVIVGQKCGLLLTDHDSMGQGNLRNFQGCNGSAILPGNGKILASNGWIFGCMDVHQGIAVKFSDNQRHDRGRMGLLKGNGKIRRGVFSEMP